MFEKKELRIEKPELTAPEMRISQGKISGGAYICRVLGKNNGHHDTFDIDYHLLVDILFRDHKLFDEIYKKHPPISGENTKNVSELLTEYLFLYPNFFMAENAPSNKTWV